jgi:hypothetical protein
MKTAKSVELVFGGAGVFTVCRFLKEPYYPVCKNVIL